MRIAGLMSRLATPPPIRAPHEWAEQHRILPDDSAEPGPYRVSRTPWVRYTSEAINNYKYKEVIAVHGAQTSKTETLLLAFGHRLHDKPAPCLWVSPSEKHAGSISKDRLNKLIRSVPELWDSIDKKNKSRYEFFVNGVRVGLGWAGSGIELSSHPIALVVADEIDFFEQLKGYGDPYVLAKKRTATYPDRCVIAVSTPTLGSVKDEKREDTGLIHWKISDNVESRIWRLYQEGTMVEFMLPCPHCHTYFAPHSINMLYIPEKATPQQAEREACLICPHCAKHIQSRYKHNMLQNGLALAPGQWVENGEIRGEMPETSIYSIFVSGYCSPWVEWGQIASNLVRAQQSGDPAELQSCYNTDLGICFEDILPVIDKEIVSRLKAEYKKGQVPDPVQRLSCYIDVQEFGLVWCVMGWAKEPKKGRLEAYIIDYGMLEGNTFLYEVWDDLEVLLDKTWGKFKLHAKGLDTGYNPSRSALAKAFMKQNIEKAEKLPTNIIYWWVRKHLAVVMTKGSSRPLNTLFKRGLVDVNYRGKQVRSGLALWTLNTDLFKTEIYAKLGYPIDKPGRWYLPADVSDDFIEQISSEFKNSDTGKWEKIRQDNHYLDCLVGNLALSAMNKWDKLKEEKENKNKPTQAIPCPKRERKSSFVEGEWF